MHLIITDDPKGQYNVINMKWFIKLKKITRCDEFFFKIKFYLSYVIQPGKKKKFIDKKSAVTFHLVHRSQRDPLQADEESSKHVLLPVEKKVCLSTINEDV